MQPFNVTVVFHLRMNTFSDLVHKPPISGIETSSDLMIWASMLLCEFNNYIKYYYKKNQNAKHAVGKGLWIKCRSESNFWV